MKIKKKWPKQIWAKCLLYFLVLIIVLSGAFISGYTTGKKGIDLNIPFVPASVVNTDTGKPANVDFSTFWDAWNKLNQDSVDTINPQNLVYGAISGMLNSLNDPYTVYFTPEENKKFQEDMSGQFEGIGVEVTEVNNSLTIVAPLPDSPAEKAGIKAKDVIISVDGQNAFDLGFQGTIDKIRGTSGTDVTLVLSRPGQDQNITIRVTREKITVPSVTLEYKTLDGKKFAYVTIRQFGDDTNNLFDGIANDILKNKPDGIVLDLRNNPGGYLDSAVDVASYFLDGGNVVSEVEKDNKKKDYKTIRRATLKDYPLAVMVNDGSASAAEILAGAIKDRARGEIIGTTTFGKGSVQILEELKDGSAIKVTIAKWLTPNGNTIDKVGIKPDLEIKADTNASDDNILSGALQYLLKK
ncbi:MAG: S41 family peptidase [Patescibacteria group bacterium]